MQDLVRTYLNAHNTDTPYPNLCTINPGASVEDAYRIQQAFVAALPGKVVGYKAALTNAPAQAAMSFDRPVVGVLFDWGQVEAGAVLQPKRRVIIETELGYRLGAAVTAPVTPEQVMGMVRTCHPLLEIAAPNLASKPIGTDLIASNSAAWQFIEGTGVDPGSFSPDNVDAELQRDGEVLHHMSSATVMEGQRLALTWLINQVLELGYPLHAGMLLMSGSIGPPQPGKPGHYRGAFSRLDPIEFTIS